MNPLQQASFTLDHEFHIYIYDIYSMSITK